MDSFSSAAASAHVKRVKRAKGASAKNQAATAASNHLGEEGYIRFFIQTPLSALCRRTTQIDLFRLR
jgi:hypothetical protein